MEDIFHLYGKQFELGGGQEDKLCEKINRATTGRDSTFNDLPFYESLLTEDGCARVNLIKVYCRHNQRFVFGIQAVYRLELENGTSQERAAPPHYYQQGYYAYTGGEGQTSTLNLEEGEYIFDVQSRKGDIVDALIFKTNRRQVQFGGNGGVLEPSQDISKALSRQVYAFAGTRTGVLHRFGFYSRNMNWFILKPLITMRQLITSKRASLGLDASELTKNQQVLASLLLEANDDIFKNALSFLAPIRS